MWIDYTVKKTKMQQKKRSMYVEKIKIIKNQKTYFVHFTQTYVNKWKIEKINIKISYGVVSNFFRYFMNIFTGSFFVVQCAQKKPLFMRV